MTKLKLGSRGARSLLSDIIFHTLTYTSWNIYTSES